MPPSVFISYRRRNLPFAERLYLDLQRASLDVWRDLNDIELGEDFERIILPAIEARSHVILLASPEAVASHWVRREVEEAQRLGKTILPIRLAGKPGTLPTEWERLNMPRNPVQNYWEVVRQLARELEAPRPELPSLTDLLNRSNGTLAEAAALLTGAETFQDDRGNRFLKLPAAPSAYCNLSLIAPADAPARWPDDLAILFHFTGDRAGQRHLQALQHWATQVPEPWMLMLEGPVNPDTNRYDMQTDQPHEWDDAICAGTRALEAFARGRKRLGYYLNCLVPMAFDIGLRTNQMCGPRRLFHFNSVSHRYDTAHDSWPTS